MAESEAFLSDDEEQNLKASMKRMVASQNRKRKKSGGFQVMGMLSCVWIHNLTVNAMFYVSSLVIYSRPYRRSSKHVNSFLHLFCSFIWLTWFLDIVGLSYSVYKGVMKKGYKVPTPIQRKVCNCKVWSLDFYNFRTCIHTFDTRNCDVKLLITMPQHYIMLLLKWLYVKSQECF